MEVILMQDVAKLGRRGEIVTVPNGHGLNKLIPQGLALAATPENKKRAAAAAAQTAADHAATDEAFAAAVAAVTDKTITVAAEANEDGKLYQALSETAILAAVAEQVGTTIEPAWLVVKNPVKTTGEHSLELANGEATGTLTIEVSAT